jgi:vanillate O-demethylase monooxygenase subunit
MGRKEGDCIRCSYHGLLFDKQGICIGAPAQERLPAMKVKSFPVVEKNKWIWIWMGDPLQADVEKIPNIWWYDHPEWQYQPGYIHYDVNYLLIADNLLDFSHLPFLHPTTLGGSPDYAAVLPKIERKENGLRLKKWVFDTQPPGYSKKYAGYPEGAKVDRWMIYDFLVPSILLMDSGMSLTNTGSPAIKPDNAISFLGAQALTPETEDKTHYFFGQARSFLLNNPEVTAEIHAGVLQAFQEDKDIIMAQQHYLSLDPNFKMLPLSIDSALSQFRWMIDKKIKEETST